jgi:2-oxoglutarate/2-oxoacid ferredoxin oxidoreductase subunit alpha
LVLGWGSTYGAIAAAADELRHAGKYVANLALRYLNPFPENLGEILANYKRILVPENNMGQLCSMLRDRYLVDAIRLPKVDGRTFHIQELQKHIEKLLGEPRK